MNVDVVLRAARWAGLDLAARQLDQLARYREWLIGEGVAAGGIGPEEALDVDRRHLADSLLFAKGWGQPPDEILDVGSGVGLPALPLAIAEPTSRVVALDRAGRRVRLLRRAARVVGVSNLTVLQGDITDIDRTFPAVVSRASLPPAALRPHLARVVAPGGVAVVGGSHVSAPTEPGYETVSVPPEVLDRPAWILIMARP